MKDEYWTMKNGEKIKVGDMTESHVKNTLRMILRSIAKSVRDDMISPDIDCPEHCMLDGKYISDPEFYKY